MKKAKREWVVQLYIQRHGGWAWEEMPEDWYAPSSRREFRIKGMYPRTFHGVVRQVKDLQSRADGWGMIVYAHDLSNCQLRNVKTGEVVPWAAMGA